MYSVATPFHPFGGAVDIIVVKQQDGTFRSTPWYVRFGKFQGVLKGAEKIVQVEVNGAEADFHMYLDNSGEAYFVREVDEGLKDLDNLEGGGVCSNHYSSFNDGVGEFSGQDNDMEDAHLNVRAEKLRRVDSDAAAYVFYEFSDEHSSVEGSPKISEYSPNRYDTLDSVEHALESQESNSEVVLVSVDGHILTAPISSSEKTGENLQLSTPQFHLGPGGGTEEYNSGEGNWASDSLSDIHRVGDTSETNSLSFKHHQAPYEGDAEHMQSSPDNNNSIDMKRKDTFKSCLELSQLAIDSNQENTCSSIKIDETTGCPINSSPPDSHVEATTQGKYGSGMDHDDRLFVQIPSNNQGSHEQVDVKKNQRDMEEDHAPEVESCKGKLVRISREAPVEFPRLDATTGETWFSILC